MDQAETVETSQDQGREGNGRGWTSGVMAISVMVTTASTFCGWATSGRRTRSSYELVDIVDRADLITGPGAGLVRLVFVVPVIAGVSLVALSVSRHRVAGMAATTVGFAVLIAAVLVDRSPLRSEWGLWLGVAAGAGAVTSGLLLAMTTTRQRERR